MLLLLSRATTTLFFCSSSVRSCSAKSRPLPILISSIPSRFFIGRRVSRWGLSSSAGVEMAENGGRRKEEAKNSGMRDQEYLDTVIQKRVKMFEEIQEEQNALRLRFGGDPIKVTLPDGTVKEGKKLITSPMDIAKEISKGLAASALIAKVDSILWDMSRPLEGDCTLELFKFESDEGRDTFWHSSAHILGQAVEVEYGCKLCIGPCTTRGEGFYYDAFYNGQTLNEEHLIG